MYENEIASKLKQLKNQGKTYEELHQLTGISRSYLAMILSGKQPVKNPTVDLLLKTFPGTTITLNGVSVRGNDNQTGNGIAVGHHNNFFSGDNSSLADYRARVISTIIDLDLPSDAMQTVLRAVKNIK